LFLHKGENPSSAANGFSFKWLNFLYPAAIPLLTAFSADEVFNHFAHPGFLESLPKTDIYFYLPAFLLLVFVLARIYFNRVGSVAYRWLLFSAYLFFLCFFMLQYCRGAAISIEGRHFRILGLLFLPGVVQLIRQVKINALKKAFQLVLLVLCLYSWNDAFAHWRLNSEQKPGKNTRVIQDLLDEETLAKIHQLDEQYPQQCLFVLMSPEIAMEVAHNRVLILPFDALKKALELDTFDGRVNRLFLIVPKEFASGKTEKLIEASFIGYKNFSKKKSAMRMC
jgi:hypothetical protein